MSDDLLSFTTTQLERLLASTRSTGESIARAGGVPELGLNGTEFAAAHRPHVRAAELRLQLLNDTIRPYLGTAGPTGRIAEQQLRIMGAEFAEVPGYRPHWAPDADS